MGRTSQTRIGRHRKTKRKKKKSVKKKDNSLKSCQTKKENQQYVITLGCQCRKSMITAKKSITITRLRIFQQWVDSQFEMKVKRLLWGLSRRSSNKLEPFQS